MFRLEPPIDITPLKPVLEKTVADFWAKAEDDP